MDGKDITVYEPAVLAADEATVSRGFWAKFRAAVGRFPLAEDLLAAYYCAVDPQTPRYVRAVLMGALAYFVIPADMIPDFVAGLGFTDDVSVLLAAVRAVRMHMSERHFLRARETLQAGKQRTSE